MVSNINYISVNFEMSVEEMHKLHNRIIDDLGTMPKFIEKVTDIDNVLSATPHGDMTEEDVNCIQVDIDFVGSMADVKATIKKIRMLIETFIDDKR